MTTWMRAVGGWWLALGAGLGALTAAEPATWRAGIGQAKITPDQSMWMGGFAARTRPSEGVLDDLWAKAIVLEAPDGGLAVLMSLDLVGVPKWLYEDLCRTLRERQGLGRAQLRFAASHTHSGPVLRDALQDIYPLDDEQRARSAKYSAWIGPVLVEAIEAALRTREPATVWTGEGRATIALNRRTNDEGRLFEMLSRGEVPQGPSDYAVPVLAVRAPGGSLRAVVFGYAAHTSALTVNYQFSADYCGVCMREIEGVHRGATALFFQGCGSDQSCAPRGSVELCRARGRDLARAVRDVLDGPMQPVVPRLRSAFEFVPLDYAAQPTRAELAKTGEGTDYRARWARRLLGELDGGRTFETAYREYPVQVWKLGERLLWIGLGGEVCVDYALRFKREFPGEVWVNGYANDVMAYIPSRRLWEEGGYQAGAFEVYGLPATRWCADIEDRISGAVRRLAAQVR